MDLLSLSFRLREGLKAAGILTVGQLEIGLANEDALLANVHGCGPKSVPLLRRAVQEYGRKPSHGGRPGHARVEPAGPKGNRNTASPSQPSGAATGPDPKTALRWVAVVLVSGIGIVGLAYCVLPLFGIQLNKSQLHGFNILWSVITAALCYVLLGRTRATFQGSVGRFTFRLGGSLAALLAAFTVLTKLTPAVAPRAIWVYVNARGEEGGGETRKLDQFTLNYRGKYGPQSAPGRNGASLAGNLSWGVDELEVESVECVGFIPVKQKEGMSPPWKYPIEKGAATIQMVRADVAEAPAPKPERVRKMVEDAGLTAERIREPGKLPKHEVSLRIENASDRPITFLAYDCVAAFSAGDKGGDVAKLWTTCKDTRRIQPGAFLIWGNFNQFESPSGWFALFVNYADPAVNQSLQCPLGVYNLFQIREPKVVIERDDGAGVGFRVSKARSVLRE